MLKSTFSILSFIFILFFCLPFGYLDGAVFSTQKSSGDFIDGKNLKLENCFDIDGATITLPSGYDFYDTVELLSAKRVHYFSDGTVENYYFFSEKLPKCEIINGKKVNMHVAVSKGKVTVGSPIIYYGY